MESLKEKVVIVTGSSSGIGEAAAVLFSKYGSKVIITGRNSQKLLRVCGQCEEVSPNNYKPLTVVGDICDDELRENLIMKTIEAYGQLDVLVNNAGAGKSSNVLYDDFPAAFDRVMNVNLRSAMFLTRLALPYLINSKGCLINISSTAAFRYILTDNLPYHVSKSAMDSMTRLLAHEFGPKGVRVVSVNPGCIKTSIHETFNETEAVYDFLAKDYPMRRPGKVEEVANVICFMASDGASFVTGTTVLVDGGQSTM